MQLGGSAAVEQCAKLQADLINCQQALVDKEGESLEKSKQLAEMQSRCVRLCYRPDSLLWRRLQPVSFAVAETHISAAALACALSCCLLVSRIRGSASSGWLSFCLSKLPRLERMLMRSYLCVFVCICAGVM